MNIREALQVAIEQEKSICYLDRAGAPVMYITPQGPFDTLLIQADDAQGKRRAPWPGWEPSAEDLIRDDWQVTERILTEAPQGPYLCQICPKGKGG